MRSGSVYILNSQEQEMIERMHAQFAVKSNDSTDAVKIDPNMSREDFHINGFGAEYAFCQMIGSDFDNTVNNIVAYSYKPDTILPDGTRIDVKQTKYLSGMLLVPITTEKGKVDVYALMTGTMPKFTFRGWAYEHEIRDRNRVKTVKYKPSFVMEQWELHKQFNFHKNIPSK